MTRPRKPLLLLLIAVALGSFGCGSSSLTPVSDASADAGGGDASSDAPGGDATSTPDAPSGPEPCSTPGETRAAACGNCGIQGQTCSPDHVWEPNGPCTDQGECSPGTTEARDDAFCGRSARTCDDTCAWRAWSETAPAGVCEPGETRFDPEGCDLSEYRAASCTSSCEWLESPCGDPCGGTRRTTPADAEEICIPAGPFIRGHTDFEDAQPVAEVLLSAYYLDRYPVTNRRYAECMAAGACTAPAHWDYDVAAATLAGRIVTGVSRLQADAFCAWDFRELPTEAQWEKAARGPSPRAQRFAWGTDTFECLDRPGGACPGGIAYQPVLPYDYDALPLSASYYGIEMLVGGGYELLRDRYDSAFYSEAQSLNNPLNDTAGYSVLRGVRLSNLRDLEWNISRRRSTWDRLSSLHTLRCARPSS